jgi:hypothetical protein
VLVVGEHGDSGLRGQAPDFIQILFGHGKGRPEPVKQNGEIKPAPFKHRFERPQRRVIKSEPAQPFEIVTKHPDPHSFERKRVLFPACPVSRHVGQFMALQKELIQNLHETNIAAVHIRTGEGFVDDQNLQGRLRGLDFAQQPERFTLLSLIQVRKAHLQKATSLAVPSQLKKKPTQIGGGLRVGAVDFQRPAKPPLGFLSSMQRGLRGGPVIPPFTGFFFAEGAFKFPARCFVLPLLKQSQA